MIKNTIVLWVLRIVPAVILLQTLFFKFTGAPEAVILFSALGVEPWGRLLLGVIELVTAVLLLVPRTTAIGAVIGLGIMIGAIVLHITFLGYGDLFIMALVVFATCAILVFNNRQYLLSLLRNNPSSASHN